MATVNKDFKIKSGLIVEGTTATVNGYDILTKNQGDQDYIVNLIGGTATRDNTPDTVVKRDGFGNFAAGQIDLDSKLTAPDVRLGNAGQIHDNDGNLEVSAYDGNALQLRADANVVINANSGNIDLNVNNGSAYVNEDEIVTRTATQQLTNKELVDPLLRGELKIEDGNNNFEALISLTSGELVLDTDSRNIILNPESGEAYVYNSNTQDNKIATEGFVNTSISNLDLANTYDAKGAAATAESNANSYTDTSISNLNLANTYDAKGAASQALSDANTYTDTAVSNLVDSAPELLNTLNELAAAIANNPNYATDIASMISGKQDTLSAGNGIKITGTTVEIDNNYTATKQYVDGLASNYDAAGSASTAQQNAENYADSLAGNYDASGSASIALQNAENYTDNAINALTTDDIEEGNSNLYFTDGRAKTSAADLLTSANLTNITITGTGSGLTITAENGVADSTTDDLQEGDNNLYFTNARAVDAIQGSAPAFETVEINHFRKEEATQQYVASASTVDVHSFGYPYESAKYLVRVVGWNGGVKHSQLTEILVTVDGNDNIAITEYGTICTDTTNLASFSARLDQTGSTRYVLTATTAVQGAEVIAAATMLSWAD